MSTTIDHKVVEMQFDNRQFERNVQTSLSTIDRLKKSLNLTGAAKGFEDIDRAANKVSFSGLNAGVEAIGVKFSNTQAIILHQINNIVDSCVRAGKRMASALTIDPIKTGFSEYETQINSVQTILANTSSKGTTLQDVNNALDTLNTYADKTIYNFTEMTRNIGTFTAAGVDLDKSVSAIQGIANLAAVSGSSSQQASNAMYQLSQALAAGRVSLMDWNSVVNAGMGGQVFQDALKRTAKNMGIVVDESKSFRESIQGSDTWLSSDVLLKTLQQFTMAAEEGSAEWDGFKKSLMEEGYTEAQAIEILKMANTATDAATKVKTFTQLWDTLKESAQSGWTQSWETIIGDFGEAKELLTEISNVIGELIGKSAEARNELLVGGLSTGWKQLLGQGIADEEGYKDSIKAVAKTHGVAFDEMIAKGEEAGKTFEEVLTESLKSGDISSGMLSESVTHLADSMRNMTEEERKAAGYTQEHLMSIEKLEAGLKDGSISMDEFVEKMQRPSGRENVIQALWNSFNALMDIVKPVKEAFRDIFPAMTADQLYGITEGLRKFTEKFEISGETADKIKRTFKGVFALFELGVNAVNSILRIFGKFVGVVAPASSGLLDFTAGIGDFLVSMSDAIEKTGFFNTIVEKIGTFLGVISGGIKDFANAISNSFGDIAVNAEERLEPLSALGRFIKGVFTGLVGIISKVAPIFTQLAHGLGSALGKLSNGVAEAIQSADYTKMFDMVNGGIFAAIGVFAARFMKAASDILSDVDGFKEGIKDVLEGAGDALSAFTGSMKAETLKKIAISIGILAAALLVLSIIDSEKLNGSLGAITVLFIEMVGALNAFTQIAGNKAIAKLPVIAATLVTLSSALLILSVAVKILSTMTWSEMGVGLISIAGGLGALVYAVGKLPEGKFKNASKAIRSLSTSLLVFSIAMKVLGSMSWNELAVGLTATVVGLGALVGALHLLPKDMAGKAGGILVLSSALVVLGGALKIMGSMSWDEIGRSLATLAGSLIILVTAMHFMTSAISGATAMLIIAPALVILGAALKSMSSMTWDEIARGLSMLGGSLLIIAGAMALMKSAIPGAAALVVVTGALNLLTPVMKRLGSMSWGEIARGLVALGGAFAIIGVAGLLLGPLVPTLLALSGAVALLGVGCAAIGAGVALVGVGITALAGALATGGVAITVFISSLIGLIPYLIEQIGVGFIALCDVISGSASTICEAFKVIVLALVDAVVASAPALAEGIFVVITEILGTLVTYTPQIVTGLFDLLIGVINALGEKLPDLIQAGVNLVTSLFSGIIETMKSIDPNALVGGILAVGAIAALVYALAGIAAITPAAMVGVVGLGIVVTELAVVLAAIGALAQIPGLEWLINEGGNFLQTIGTAIGKFVGGIVGGIATGVTASLPQMATDLSTFMSNLQPFIDGAKMLDATAMSGVESLVGVILGLTAANVIDGLTSWFTGGSSLAKFGEEIAAFGPSLKAYADSVAGIDPTTVTASASAAKALSELANNLPNDGGVVSWFAGDNTISGFASQLPALGAGIKGFSDSVTGINVESVTSASNAVKSIAKMFSSAPADTTNISAFGGSLDSFGGKLKSYFNKISGITPAAIATSTAAITSIKTATSRLDGGTLNQISDALVSFVKAIDNYYSKMATAGKKSLDEFEKGLKSKTSSIEKTCETVIKDCVKALSGYSSKFESAGKQVAVGFANGIDKNAFMAKAKAKAMAQAALDAAEDELDINSPSREFYRVGDYAGQGFVNALSDYGRISYKAGSAMADSARKGLGNAINKIGDSFDLGSINTQPTIRPVLDLSEVRTGASAISGLFSNPSVGVAANVNAISAMSGRNQNGVNDDVVSAIKDLKRVVGNLSNTTYQIGGVTYDDGTNISTAVRDLVRAAKIERRV